MPEPEKKQIQLHKNKPIPSELPAWFTNIKLVSEKPSEKEKKFLFRTELPDARVKAELHRKVALYCSRRCIYPNDEYESKELEALSKGEEAP